MKTPSEKNPTAEPTPTELITSFCKSAKICIQCKSRFVEYGTRCERCTVMHNKGNRKYQKNKKLLLGTVPVSQLAGSKGH